VNKRLISTLSFAALVCGLAATANAQGRAKLDRSVVPSAGPAPQLHVPAWTRTTLSNGAELLVSEKHDLPLVSVTINFLGGANQFEDPQKLGVAAFTAQMLSEGTTTRTGDQLADAEQLLGTHIDVGVGGESGSIAFTALADKLDAALDLAADMLLHPTFPAEALERLRQQRLVALTQAKDQPQAIANNVFSHVVYGNEHPYGRVVTEQTVKAITRDDVVSFAQNYFKPGRAVIVVVGDVEPARVRAAFEKSFAEWQAGGDRPTFAYPAVPAAHPTTIYLVDKPNAAQSIFAIGEPGPARLTPDFYALQVMNTILGGLFQSRLNHLIREVRGFSYGVGSGFSYGKGPGPFRAGGAIVTAKSDSALVDFMAQLKGVQGGVPFTDDEIEQGKANLIQSLPRRFTTVDNVGNAISAIYLQGLPDNYFQNYAANVNAVTADDLVRVAKQYLDLDHLDIIVVGDRAVIEEPLRKTGIAPIVPLDVNGNPIPATP
jgi:zinc protease